MNQDIDYGPLTPLIGSWQGDKGTDIAPDPEGSETNPFYETIVFEPIGDVTNAESQILVALHYRQIVRRKSNDQVFHDQTGYWMWDAGNGTLMQSLTIPRAVCVLAGGRHGGSIDADGNVTLEVAAAIDNAQWGIVQSPFMQDNARTMAFNHRIIVGDGRLSYAETTLVDIYGKPFEHTDENELVRQ